MKWIKRLKELAPQAASDTVGTPPLPSLQTIAADLSPEALKKLEAIVSKKGPYFAPVQHVVEPPKYKGPISIPMALKSLSQNGLVVKNVDVHESWSSIGMNIDLVLSIVGDPETSQNAVSELHKWLYESVPYGKY